MPVAKHTIVFARIVPSELNIVTTENNNVIDLALCCQLRDPLTGDDIWQTLGANTVSRANVLSWTSFTESFYGGGDGDFGVSQVAGRMLTMIGVSGEYANGVPQAGSALTHMSDRGRTDQDGGTGDNATVSVSGVSVLNDVIDSVVYDLGLPHDAWDSCSYMNVVNQLQDIHTVGDVARVSGKTQQSCALSMSALVHEIASNYDENMGLNADLSTSAVNQLYANGLEAAIDTAMGNNNAANAASALQSNQRHILVLSVMFKNSTPGVRNVEFRIHFMVDNLNSSKALETLAAYSSEAAHFLLDGTQS